MSVLHYTCLGLWHRLYLLHVYTYLCLLLFLYTYIILYECITLYLSRSLTQVVPTTCLYLPLPPSVSVFLAPHPRQPTKCPCVPHTQQSLPNCNQGDQSLRSCVPVNEFLSWILLKWDFLHSLYWILNATWMGTWMLPTW